MTIDLPEISLGYGDDGAPAIYVDVTPVQSAPEMMGLAPWICAPDQALLCAQAVNHLAQQQTYTVIEDPAQFSEWYRARYAAEAPGIVSPDAAYGLRGFGLPEFDMITVPSILDQTLTFFAVNRQIGLPYKVTAPLNALDTPEYDPLPMTGKE